MSTATPTLQACRRPGDRAGALSPPAIESPIIVSGLARSGTTWMQWFLSQHPRIHIHGQTPNLPWSEWWQWRERLVAQGQWAAESNSRHGYEIAHYAGSDRQRSEAAFKQLFHDYMTGMGPQRPRWGLKWVNLACQPEAVRQVARLWPDTRWILCIRDPFVTIASTKNTFAPQLDLHSRAAAWVEVCRVASSYGPDRRIVVQIDRLARQLPAQREEAMRRVLQCVGEEPSEETNRFVRRWPRVHKVKPDEERTFELSEPQKQKLLTEVPELAAWMAKLGYLPEGCQDRGEPPWNG